MINIQNALANNKFVLYYQPKINLRTNKVDSAEALIRIIDNGQIIYPSDFILQAEETGEIIDISKWVFKRVIQDARYIHVKTEDNIEISFNVSAHHFTEKNLIKDLKDIFHNTRDFESKFVIELTESAMIHNTELTINKMKQLKAFNFNLSLDDFGTGYSSLASLKTFPMDEIKIDKLFIDNITKNNKDLNIVESTIFLAKKLNLTTIAEGVETIGQLNILKNLGCDKIQGYHYSKPLPIESFILYTRATNKSKSSKKFISWDDKYTTNNYAIDTQHMIIVNMLNKMYTILQDKEKRARTNINEFIQIIDNFMANHFEDEKKYMMKYNYPFMDEHIKQHQEMLQAVKAFSNNLSESNENNLFNLFKIVKDLFLKHESTMDKKMVKYIERKIIEDQSTQTGSDLHSQPQ